MLPWQARCGSILDILPRAALDVLVDSVSDNCTDACLWFLATGRSRVLRGQGLQAGAASQLVRLLKHCRRLKDYSELVAYLRGLAPSALDAQLREMQVRQCCLIWQGARLQSASPPYRASILRSACRMMHYSRCRDAPLRCCFCSAPGGAALGCLCCSHDSFPGWSHR